MAKVDFTVTGEIISIYKGQQIKMDMIKISVLKDDQTFRPVSINMDCQIDKVNIDKLTKYLKIKENKEKLNYNLSFSLNQNVMFDYINQINKIIDLNSLISIGNGALIILDNYNFISENN